MTRMQIAGLGRERIAGADCDGRTLVTWGERLLEWRLSGGRPRVLRGAGPLFGQGGCLMEEGAIVTEAGEPPALAWYAGARRELDRGVVARDVLPATLDGRRGVVVVQRGMQVRFYTLDGRARDLYSFYSASEQGGLLLQDVDGDGRADIVCGNYWMQCPPRFDLPWRLFAIRVWAEEPLSGVSSFLWRSGRLLAAQSAMAGARLAWFDPPPDPQQLWREQRIEGALGLQSPHLVDTPAGALVAERGGGGRLILAPDHGAPRILGATSGVVYAKAIGDRLLVVERSRISWIEGIA
ncbi:MAG: hypothetical protein HYR60_06980 [Acidobacteria bacterium]|nr:hypothetical protein [Acidobacteriota bacterium]